MRLIFMRHAQSVGNTDGQYNLEMSGALTPHGEKQAEALAGALAAELNGVQIDAILVSPLERTVKTILPFLKATGRRAEVWGELAEMRGRRFDGEPEMPDDVRYGGPVAPPQEALPHLTFREDESGKLLPPAKETYHEGQRRTAMAAERIMSRFGGREVTVLLVGHACAGARLLESLMRIALDGRFQHVNTGMTGIEQKANGDFIVRYVNRTVLGTDLVSLPPLVRPIPACG